MNLIKSDSHSPKKRMRLAKEVALGNVCRIGRGIYRASDEYAEHEEFLVAVHRHPRGVICLLSALQYWGITTQMPQQVWMSLPPDVSRPRNASLRVFVWTGVSYEYGQVWQDIAGEKVRVYSVAKSITDAFRFRNKIGINVAIESLRMGLEQKKVTLNEIVDAAKACRVFKVMMPYLEVYYV